LAARSTSCSSTRTGKKSLGLDLADPAGLDILYRLAATSDVLLTNKMPGVRQG
jgi:crotonobetainyl-CoA:carnitine CoA-transferase CaiB-like acyl-CoA transferase